MSQFNESPKSGKILTEDQIADQEREGQERKTFADRLAEKGREKGFMETNNAPYNLSKVTVVLICAFYVLSAAPFVYFLFNGHFAYLGETAAMAIAGTLTAGFLVVVEYLRFRNAEKLLYAKFFKKTIAREKVFFAAFFTVLTASMSFFGLPKLMEQFHPAPPAKTFVAKTPDEIRAIYEPQIVLSKQSAQAFFEASSWQGKLAPKSSRRYNELLSSTSKLQASMTDALDRLEKSNETGKVEIVQANTAAVREHDKKVAGLTTTLIWVIVGLEMLFWYAFYFKERFERFAYVELLRTGQLPSPNRGGGQPNGNGGKKPETGKQSIFPEHSAPVVQLAPFASQNKLVVQKPENGFVVQSVIQNEQVVLQSIDESVNAMITYWKRSRDTRNQSVAAENMKKVEKIGEGLRERGFAFNFDGDTLHIFDPNANEVEERNRSGAHCATIYPKAMGVQKAQAA